VEITMAMCSDIGSSNGIVGCGYVDEG